MNEPVIEWGMAAKLFPGEDRSGDRHVLVQDRRRVLMAVIDGMGHGAGAADAAQAAAEVIEEHAKEPLDEIFGRCHLRLSRTRGAAISMACFNAATQALEWLGVGNVMAALWRGPALSDSRNADLLVRSGVVGLQLPSLTVSSTNVSNGDVLALATDGISTGFVEDVNLGANLQREAPRILADYQIANDDALVLLVRFKGMEQHDERQ